MTRACDELAVQQLYLGRQACDELAVQQLYLGRQEAYEGLVCCYRLVFSVTLALHRAQGAQQCCRAPISSVTTHPTDVLACMLVTNYVEDQGCTVEFPYHIPSSRGLAHWAGTLPRVAILRAKLTEKT